MPTSALTTPEDSVNSKLGANLSELTHVVRVLLQLLLPTIHGHLHRFFDLLPFQVTIAVFVELLPIEVCGGSELLCQRGNLLPRHSRILGPVFASHAMRFQQVSHWPLLFTNSKVNGAEHCQSPC